MFCVLKQKVLLVIKLHCSSFATGSGSEKFPRVNRSLLDRLGRSSVEIHNSANEIVFTQWYGPPPHNFSMKVSGSTTSLT